MSPGPAFSATSDSPSDLDWNAAADELATLSDDIHDLESRATLLWDREPAATASTIRRRLDAAVADLGAPGRDPAYGFGRLDLARAAG